MISTLKDFRNLEVGEELTFRPMNERHVSRLRVYASTLSREGKNYRVKLDGDLVTVICSENIHEGVTDKLRAMASGDVLYLDQYNRSSQVHALAKNAGGDYELKTVVKVVRK